MQSGFDIISGLKPAHTALFLDFDGTLADIVENPDAAEIGAETLGHLDTLLTALDGALAIITGRDLESVDRFTHPHTFPASGIHGFAHRPSADPAAIDYLDIQAEALDRITASLAGVVEAEPGLILERKPAAVALHYRQRPELAEECATAVASAMAASGPDAASLKLLSGKCVYEIKGHAGDKGRAIGRFLQAFPFEGRTPVFIGDDVTDEAAFAVVNARGGISIKVGDGETAACYRLADPTEVRAWLALLVRHFV